MNGTSSGRSLLAKVVAEAVEGEVQVVAVHVPVAEEAVVHVQKVTDLEVQEDHRLPDQTDNQKAVKAALTKSITKAMAHPEAVDEAAVVAVVDEVDHVTVVKDITKDQEKVATEEAVEDHEKVATVGSEGAAEVEEGPDHKREVPPKLLPASNKAIARERRFIPSELFKRTQQLRE